jgi:hypothetical protein
MRFLKTIAMSLTAVTLLAAQPSQAAEHGENGLTAVTPSSRCGRKAILVAGVATVVAVGVGVGIWELVRHYSPDYFPEMPDECREFFHGKPSIFEKLLHIGFPGQPLEEAVQYFSWFVKNPMTKDQFCASYAGEGPLPNPDGYAYLDPVTGRPWDCFPLEKYGDEASWYKFGCTSAEPSIIYAGRRALVSLAQNVTASIGDVMKTSRGLLRFLRGSK